MKTRVVVLAAGKGTRMNSEIPKVLTPVNGKPMVQYLLDAIRASSVDARPVLVVGYRADLVIETLGDQCDYVEQTEQLGTGHAVACTESFFRGKTENVMVLYGDHPFLKPTTISSLHDLHAREGCVLSLMTTMVEDFGDWRKPFYDFGRVIRNASGDIESIIELKDANDEERKIREVNPALMCFRAEWLWKNLKKLKNENAKGEYYLTDLLRIAIDGGEKIAAMDVSPLESIGVNTQAHLELAEKLT